jgi:hypothetical protein
MRICLLRRVSSVDWVSESVTQHIQAKNVGLQKTTTQSKALYFLGLILLAFSQLTSAAAKIEHWQTPQGSRVYYVRTEGLPMVDIQVIFDGGSASDGQQFGLAALTADLLDTGAGKWNADEIAQRFESVGAHFGISS